MRRDKRSGTPTWKAQPCTRIRIMSSRDQEVNGKQGLCALPQHVWCWVSQYTDVATTGATLGCDRLLHIALQVGAIWQHHAFSTACARHAQVDSPGWFCAPEREAPVSRCIDWRGLLWLNRCARRGPSAWVKVDDVELKMPLVRGYTDNVTALVGDLSYLIHAETVEAPLPSLGRRSVGGCSAKSPESLTASRGRPFRLRRMLWGGRPGTLVEESTPMAGGYFLLERASPGGKRWPLPPTSTSLGSSHEDCLVQRAGASCSAFVLPGRRGGFARGPGMTRTTEVPTLLRVTSTLLPHEIWLTICLDGTLEALYQEISKALKAKSPLLAEFSGECEFHLMDAADRKVRSNSQPSQQLREIFWAQSETVRVELEGSHRQPPHRCTSGGSPTLLVWREKPFMEMPAPSLSRTNRVPAWGSASSSNIRTRYGGSPVPSVNRSTWARSTTEPAHLPTRGWMRQVSEPTPPRTQETLWERQCSSPTDTYGSLEGVSNSGDLSDLDELMDTLETEDDGTCERLVPHYRPRLLPQTAKARQFEFHPTMPDLMLIGDKGGTVNVLDIGSEEVHPPLVIGSCPLLGLVWLRNHPQTAVCGASHSGKIAFLRYDPNARINEPSVQKLQDLEEFPKLSSLSTNCTDDFMLASGISTNIAVYDVPTGKLVHRAFGIHDHLINISRFCHNSPHIFATASFDYTCRIWDLRQPITHNRAVKTLNTGGHNVMCVFSPDDKHLLCSGVDTRLCQFEVPSWRQTPEKFPLREPTFRERYRRSTYLASGQHFVTAATEESHFHLLSVKGKKHGVVDFRGLIRQWSDSCEEYRPGENRLIATADARRHTLLQPPAPEARSPWSFMWGTGAQQAARQVVTAPPQLVHGTVQLDASGPGQSSTPRNFEFVQSIRTHPTIQNRVGVLLSHSQVEQSFIALVDMELSAANT